ncbi:N-acetylmuramoyl-L-alanine amidase AmiD precursor (plasmid) [Piscirickettsia salmonis]|uniref:N-acetylmuramoyl-L-alanine amidase n=1 Tax=Piscirickettsia salmonis TaxID=1238 RepID=UPI0012BB038A|nr:N-acetylmuramoyl-L-alanine amidase [Piscirickettsia salmonis]QGP57155.1 N-acetylmuramoyl-L-alanine amidase AmiD precursor [Piscirickettsia salmonis]QGP61929.1 N-acetylmuramoyl-L-alanine amidase AmiD precursor [Piscirickettsia salmonis]QGP66673.1 N-acetylmuramoyl-L-alanine amidase AmiD precursor [Piscirickettsia salmonis]
MNINYNFSRSKSYNERARFLILHYTAGNFEISLKELTTNVSSHYLVPLNKKDDPSYPLNEVQIMNIVDEKNRAWHAGVSAFQDRVNLNDSSIGIEIVNLTKTIENFLPYPDYQINLIIELCQNILARHQDIIPQRVLGHSDIAFDRKSDPGPLFPWKRLYDSGIGAWFDDDTVIQYKQALQKGLVTLDTAYEKIQEYGYCGDRHNTYCKKINKNKLVRAFQMHFRASKYDGILDEETASIMLALWTKYTASGRFAFDMEKVI